MQYNPENVLVCLTSDASDLTDLADHARIRRLGLYLAQARRLAAARPGTPRAANANPVANLTGRYDIRRTRLLVQHRRAQHVFEGAAHALYLALHPPP